MSLSIFGKKSFVGIDIGHKTIQIVQLDKASSGFRISKSVTVPTPSESVKDGVITDPDVVGLAIKGALREHKISATSAIAAVSGGAVTVRVVDDMPKMSEDMLRKSIKYEAGRYVPQSVEDSFIEYEVLDDTMESQMKVMIVAAPREIVASRLRALERAGLDVEAIDVEAFAMYRTLVETNDSTILNEMTIALVDIGASLTTVSVISQGTFAITRTIPQGSQLWTDSLQDYFKLEPDDAEAGKAQLDLTPLTSDSVIDNPPLRTIQSPVDDLIREVRRSLNYYQSQSRDGVAPPPVTHVVISGGGSKLAGLASYFAHKLGTETVALGVNDNPKFLPHAEMDHLHGLEYSVAVGLAMRPYMKVA